MSETEPSTQSGPPAGWYDDPDGSGRQRWYDGSAFTEHFQSAPTPQPQQPVQVTVAAPVQTDARKARDKAVYTREQKGHSITAWILISLFTGGIGLIWVIYYSASPNHFWHA